jgi:large subunit ribosomal protein L25
MSNDFQLNATVRNDMGKGASRRLRRLAKVVPAIIYGGKSAPQNISLTQNELEHALENEAFYSHIITLNVEGKTEDVILKDVQRHPAKPVILHVDFFRVSKTQKLQTKVPLHFINEETCAGVKLSGGNISHSMTELDISCLPGDLPEYIEVDVEAVEIGQILHISDIKLPKGVESIGLSHGEEHDLPIFTVNKPKAVVETEDTEEPDAESQEEEGNE